MAKRLNPSVALCCSEVLCGHREPQSDRGPRIIKSLVMLVCIFFSVFSYAQETSYTIGRLIIKEDFDILDTSRWIIEKSPADSERVAAENGKLLLDTYGGATVWLKQELTGNYLIRFKRTIIVAGGKNDRLSDCNQFWMASDPLHNKLFRRKGAFNEYDSLLMYYVGMGGNYNTTTRFRRYDGKGNKKIIGEFTDSSHLLLPNKEYAFEIVVKDGYTSFRVDGALFFSFKDPDPIKRGWFAFRSTRSRQAIDGIEIYLIK